MMKKITLIMFFCCFIILILPAEKVTIWEFDALAPVNAQLDTTDGTAWNPTTNSLDTNDYKSGTASLSGVLTLSSPPAVNAQITNWGTIESPKWATPLNINVSSINRNCINIWIYLEDNNLWADDHILSVKLGSGANINENNVRYVWRRSDFPNGIFNGWSFFEKPVSNTFSQTGTLNWADIDWIEIQIYGSTGNQSSIVKLDGLSISSSSLAEKESNIKKEKVVLHTSVIQNYTFNEDSGQLVSIKNLVTNDEYLKGNSPFLPFDIVINNKTLTLSDINNVKVSNETDSNQDTLNIKYEINKWNAEILLRVIVTKDSPISTWYLSVFNKSNQPMGVSGYFPKLNYVTLGEKRSDNFIAGTSDGVGYVRPISEVESPSFGRGGDRWYGGSNTTMQWCSQFDKEKDEGLGIIVKDKNIYPKILGDSLNSIWVRYPEFKIEPNKAFDFPPTEVIIHIGDWKKVAELYRLWFLETFKLNKPPKWFYEDKYSMLGIDKGNRNTRIANDTGVDGYFTQVKNFENLVEVLNQARATGSSVIEISNYQDYWPKYQVANDGDYIPREDLGSGEALKRGVQEIHRRGGRVLVYIEGLLTWTQSNVAKSGKSEQWAVKRESGDYQFDYNDRWSECVSEKGWQDYLVNKCVEYVRDYDMDGIRLDSLGATSFHFCYNPKHEHYPNPLTWNQGLIELVQKVKTAITKIKPDAVLLTEGPVDFLYQYTDGALATPLGDEYVTRYTLPELYMVSIMSPDYKNDAPAISSVNGYPWCQWGYSLYVNRQGASPPNPSLERNWTYLRYTFKDAIIYGTILDNYPLSEDKNILARTYEAQDYYLVLGAKLNAQNAKGTFKLLIKEITLSDNNGILIDVDKYECFPINFKSSNNNISVDLDKNNFAIFIPKRNCRPFVFIKQPLEIIPGETITLKVYENGLSLFQKKDINAEIWSPSLMVNNDDFTLSGNKKVITLSSSLNITVPKNKEGGRYIVKIEDTNDGKDFCGTYCIVDVKDPLTVTFDIIKKDNRLELSTQLINNTQKPMTVGLELKRPDCFKMNPVEIIVQANEKKSIQCPIELTGDFSKNDYVDLYYKFNEFEDFETLSLAFLKK